MKIFIHNLAETYLKQCNNLQEMGKHHHHELHCGTRSLKQLPSYL